jgi:hypothetical protein
MVGIASDSGTCLTENKFPSVNHHRRLRYCSILVIYNLRFAICDFQIVNPCPSADRGNRKSKMKDGNTAKRHNSSTKNKPLATHASRSHGLLIFAKNSSEIVTQNFMGATPIE